MRISNDIIIVCLLFYTDLPGDNNVNTGMAGYLLAFPPQHFAKENDCLTRVEPPATVRKELANGNHLFYYGKKKQKAAARTR